MPSRKAPRCGRTRGLPDQIDELVEMNLTYGDAFGLDDLRRLVDFTAPWARWKVEITARWAEAFPGSRPLAAYITGDIAPPSWQHELPALRRPFRAIEGGTVAMPDIGWHMTQAELDHLDHLRLIDADEHDRALARLEGEDATYHGRYRPLAHQQPTTIRPENHPV
jgi:hypothetical protein